MYIHIYINMDINMDINMHIIYIYIRMRAHICIYIYIYIYAAFMAGSIECWPPAQGVVTCSVLLNFTLSCGLI
jgi:hypothetical protein